jgi:hypothetical protein
MPDQFCRFNLNYKKMGEIRMANRCRDIPPTCIWSVTELIRERQFTVYYWEPQYRSGDKEDSDKE